MAQIRNWRMLLLALLSAVVLLGGVSTMPLAHAVDPVTVLFIDQFGTSDIEVATSIDTFESGVYVVGLQGPANVAGDAFLRKYDTDGNFQWHTLISTSESDTALHVAVDASGVYVVGDTEGDLEGTSQGSFDAYLRKYDHDGNVQWTVQFGTSAFDHANSIALDGTGVYTGGGIDGPTGTPFGEAYVNKYDFDGNLVWMDQFGTVPGADAVTEVATDSTSVYATGMICCDENDGSDIFLAKYDSAGNQEFFVVSSAPGSDQTLGLAVDSTGVYIGGGTTSDLEEPLSGPSDAFLRKYDSTSAIQWTHQFGSTSSDTVFSVGLDESGIYLAGGTSGAIEGTFGGSLDAFAMKLVESAPTSVSIDIKPGDSKNTISVNNDKSIKVAILGSESFLVDSVDVSPLADAPLFGGLTPRSPVSASYEDVNGDGFTDLLLKYNSGKQNPLGLTRDFTSACISGSLIDGTLIEGCDRIRVVK